MNEEHTRSRVVSVKVVGYDDGVYNLEMRTGGEVVKLDIDEQEAEHVCDFFGVDCPDPEPTPVERWS